MKLQQIKNIITILEALPDRKDAKLGDPYLTHYAEGQLKALREVLPEMERLTLWERRIKNQRRKRK